MNQAAESRVGTVLKGAYRIDRRLGEGGMGVVYAATHLRLGKVVAIKVMTRDLASNTEALMRLHREAQVTSALGHPHIVQVFDFATTPTGEPYLVMEFLHGEDLERRLRRTGPMPAPTMVHIIMQVASALAATHAKAIVHRDLKPSNIYLIEMAGESDFVKVLDFGIEQAKGELEEIDGRSDQWALACIAWECLCGTGPFAGDNVGTRLLQIVNEQPPSLLPKVPGLSPQVEDVLLRGLAKDRSQRFPNVGDFAAALEAAVAGNTPGPAVRSGVVSRPTQLGDAAQAQSAGRPPLPRSVVSAASKIDEIPKIPPTRSQRPSQRPFRSTSPSPDVSREITGSRTPGGSVQFPVQSPVQSPVVDLTANQRAKDVAPAPAALHVAGPALPAEAKAEVMNASAEVTSSPNDEVTPRVEVIWSESPVEILNRPTSTLDQPASALEQASVANLRRPIPWKALTAGLAILAGTALVFFALKLRTPAPRIDNQAESEKLARLCLDEAESLAAQKRFVPAAELIERARSLPATANQPELFIRLTRVRETVEMGMSLRKAQGFLDSNDSDRAAATAKGVLERDPTNAEALRIIGLAGLARQPREAVRHDTSSRSQPPATARKGDAPARHLESAPRAAPRESPALPPVAEVAVAPRPPSPAPAIPPPPPKPRPTELAALAPPPPSAPPPRPQPRPPVEPASPPAEAARAPAPAPARPQSNVDIKNWQPANATVPLPRLPRTQTAKTVQELAQALQHVETEVINQLGVPAGYVRGITQPLRDSFLSRMPCELYPSAIYYLIGREAVLKHDKSSVAQTIVRIHGTDTLKIFARLPVRD